MSKIRFPEITEPVTPPADKIFLYVDQADGFLKIKNDAGTVSILGQVTDLDALTDVVITAPSNGEALLYDGANWVNGALSLPASSVTFTPNGDITSTDVQSAIVEVRDDTDTKLALKQDTSEKGVANGYASLDANGDVPFTELPLAFDQNSDDTDVSTTSTTFSTAYTFNTASLPAGTYMLHVFFVYEPNSTSGDARFQWRVDTVNQGPESREEGKDVGDDQEVWRSGFFPVTLTAGVHTVDLQFAESGGGTLVAKYGGYFLTRIS